HLAGDDEIGRSEHAQGSGLRRLIAQVQLVLGGHRAVENLLRGELKRCEDSTEGLRISDVPVFRKICQERRSNELRPPRLIGANEGYAGGEHAVPWKRVWTAPGQ